MIIKKTAIKAKLCAVPVLKYPGTFLSLITESITRKNAHPMIKNAIYFKNIPIELDTEITDFMSCI